MSLNTYLDNTASNLIIKGDEKDAIAKSLDVFKSRMENYFFWNETVNLKEITALFISDNGEELIRNVCTEKNIISLDCR